MEIITGILFFIILSAIAAMAYTVWIPFKTGLVASLILLFRQP